jgi:hypothetical protein
VVVVRAGFQDSKLLVEIPGKERKEGDERQNYVGDERVGAGGEGRG